jgi:hypothetical protein
MTQNTQVKDSHGSLHQGSGVRFNLKKRSTRGMKLAVNLSSYNSDFLDGLFADVAKVSDSSETSGKRTADSFSSCEGSCVARSPSKKTRVSLHRSMSRVLASARNLSTLGTSPKGINEFFTTSTSDSQGNDCLDSSPLNLLQDSLQLKTTCVSAASGATSGRATQVPNPTSESSAKLLFPNLPATVSDSSCNAGLTRVNLVRQASIPEKLNKEAFGWFVDLDDNLLPEANSNLPYTVSSDSLAFQAPTAPKAVRDHEELEWAQAADTVDDVLGDFF